MKASGSGRSRSICKITRSRAWTRSRVSSELDSATLSGVLDRLQDNGWLVRNTPDGDRRVTNLHLTQKALGIKDAMLKDVEAVNREVLSIFKPEERLLLERMLKDLWR